MATKKATRKKTDRQTTPKSTSSSATVSSDNGKVCAILSYLLVGIIWYLADDNMRKNKFAQYHASQATGLLIVSIIGNILGTMLPIIGWFVILPLTQIFVLVLFIIGIYNAVNDLKNPLPLIGKYSENIFK